MQKSRNARVAIFSLIVAAIAMELLIGFYFYIHPWIPGIAIAILAFLAIILTLIPKKISLSRNVMWILGFLILLVLEIHNIAIDQAKRDEGQQKELQNQQAGFESILTANQEQFSKTLEESQAIQSITQESLDNITGGDSIPFVVPQIQAGTNPIPLAIWDDGKYILSGVTVVIQNENDFITSSNPPAIDVGVVNPDFAKILSEEISPSPDTSGIDTYVIQIWTQDNFFTETLQLKLATDTPYWTYQYWVDRWTFERNSTSSTSYSTQVKTQLW